MSIRIGYAQSIITPALVRPVFLAGFGQNRRAVDVHDDLFARVLVVCSDSETLVLCALDLIGFFRKDVLEITERIHLQTPGAQLILASTHTHHGPDSMGLWGPDDKTSGVDALYMHELKEIVIATILDALSSLNPASLLTASIHVPGVAKNARNPAIVDDELSIAQFIDPHGKALASLFNFPCHPEVLWEHNPHISADYPGVLRREVERASAAPCIFFAGALGGMMTPDVKEHSFDEAELIGKKLAEEGLKAIESKALRAQPDQISIRKAEINLKLTNVLYKLAFWRKLLPDTRNKRGELISEVNLLKIGPLWLATVPGEMLPELGMALKNSLISAGAGVAGVIGLANDELGYILPKEDFKYPLNPFRPGKHYEETNAIGKEIGPRVIEALLSLL
ncbi:MAG: hypothetical protein NTW32_12765 [Chloroflexi bacterium]|nr:hypothetical protein [Chloroflexota bacterium]